MSNYVWDAIVRRVSLKGNGTQNPLRQTSFESLAIAAVEGDNWEALRQHMKFAGGCQVIASGIAPVAAIPTTTATLALYNTASDGGKSILLEKLAFTLGSGTAAAGATLFATVSNGKLASVPSAASNYSSQCLSGDPTATSIARWATGVTIPAGSAWAVAASSFQLAAANVGQGDQPAAFPGGGILVRPGCALGLAILSGAGTTPLYTVSAYWSEAMVDVEE